VKRELRIACVSLVGIIGARATLNAQQVHAEEVVAACAEALGGAAAIDAVRTLRLTYRLPDHGGGAAVLEIRRPNLLRMGDFAVFDGSRAALLDRPPLPDGTERPAELVDAAEWPDFEMQIGWFFPAFFDYPSEYGGIEVIEGIETHKLEVRLPLGVRLTYFIDAATSLPLMLESHVALNGKDHRYSRFFGDYRETAGMLYPRTYTYYSFHVRQMFTVAIDELEINAPLDERRFAIPARLR
jgi:hypothetical protein